MKFRLSFFCILMILLTSCNSKLVSNNTGKDSAEIMQAVFTHHELELDIKQYLKADTIYLT
ncbi:type III secretory pathway lipoprotein EscJ [Mucilaginibacter terrae]|uniref:Type III secretory pathway lipoprotein EscJ n=1 Tax=Mucilaginibacter terrae TaxID=1955052 RepID=A0ABU3GY29_9SPHI|nr:type III secretory pathway lipoprotein EscJ [Mucilaginibacter terrae]